MSQSGTSLLLVSVCEKISAAATGVPKSAPMVPAEARIVQSSAPTRGKMREPRNTARPIFTAIMGCSGPRLTPPARPTINAMINPGSAEGGTGAPISGSSAGSGPAWPGLNRITRPTAIPVNVSIKMIHAEESAVIPSFAGSAVHSRACSTDATFITTMSTRLDATPMMSAGIASNSMVLARGWSMMISLYKTV